MPDTAPVPNIVPIPGMNQGTVIAAGSGGSGGDDANAGDGDDKENASGGTGGDDAEGGSNNANGCGPGSDTNCPQHPGGNGSTAAGDPVDVITGDVFTLPHEDLNLPGPVSLRLIRSYSSTRAAHEDPGGDLGFGWAHSLGWELEIRRLEIVARTGAGNRLEFERIPVGGQSIGRGGLLLKRTPDGYTLDDDDDDDGATMLFADPQPDAKSSDVPNRRIQLTRIQERNGIGHTLEYEHGRLVRIQDAAGRIVHLRRDGAGRIARLEVEAAGTLTPFGAYRYDDHGDLVSYTDADGFTWRYRYTEHRLVELIYPTGIAFHFRYDTELRCTETWGSWPEKEDPSLAPDVPRVLADKTPAKGIYHSKINYGPEGYREVVDAVRTLRYFGNRFGKADKVANGAYVTTRTYDRLGKVTSMTDPLGKAMTWERDSRGRVLRAVDRLGRTTVFVRDGRGRLVEVRDPGGGVTRYRRDVAGNVESIVDPSGAVFSFVYDRGYLVEQVSPSGGRTRVEYDAHGNIVQAVEPNGAVWRSSYDPLGRMTSVTNPLGQIIRMEWSPGGRLLAVHNPDGGVERRDYDGMGNIIRYELPDGRSWRIEYGGFNRLWRVHKPDGTTLEVQYDREGRLRRILNARGEAHDLVTNQQGFLAEERTFDGRHYRYTYDGNANRLRIEDATGVINMTYDAEGQMLAREFPDGSVQSFEYSPLGAVTMAKIAGTMVRFEFDANGRVVREHQTLDGETHTITRNYDLTGRVATFDASIGLRLDIRRDTMGERQQLLVDGVRLHSWTRDLLQRETDVVLPGGATIQTAYDALHRAISRRVLPKLAMSSAEPEWLASRSTVDIGYEYSKAGDLLTRSDKAAGIARFEHDALGQLTKVLHDDNLAEVFRFDETCNIYRDGVTTAYSAGDVIQRRGDVEYVSDSEARLVEKRERTPGVDRVTRYDWSDTGLLHSVATGNSRVEFTYDAFSRRLGKKSYRRDPQTDSWTLASRTRFVWNEQMLLHEIREDGIANGDPVVIERTYLHDETARPFAHREKRSDRGGTNWLYYVGDSSGFAHHLVDDSGAVVHAISHDAFGKVRASENADVGTPLRFLGQYEDSETGLFYNRFRYYDPDVGRYISPDPQGIGRGLNAFRYAENRPNEIADPLGLSGPCTTTVTGTTPDGTPITATGASAGINPDARDRSDSSAWPAPVYNGIQAAQGSKSPVWPAGSCAEPDGVANYLDAAKKSYTDKGQTPPSDEELLKGITKIQTKDKDGPRKPCGHCGKILGSMGLLDKCDPPAGSSKGK